MGSVSAYEICAEFRFAVDVMGERAKSGCVSAPIAACLLVAEFCLVWLT